MPACPGVEVAKAGGLHEETAGLGRLRREHFLEEVLPDAPSAVGARRAARVREEEARRPALHRRDCSGRGRTEQCLRLGIREPQVAARNLDDLGIGPQPVHTYLGLPAADEHEMHRRRQGVGNARQDCSFERPVEDVQGVEHEERRAGRFGSQLAGVPEELLGRAGIDRRAPAARTCEQPVEAMRQCGPDCVALVVAGVERDPRPVRGAAAQVRRDERRLSGAGRARHDGHPAAGGGLEPGVEARAGDIAIRQPGR